MFPFDLDTVVHRAYDLPRLLFIGIRTPSHAACRPRLDPRHEQCLKPLCPARAFGFCSIEHKILSTVKHCAAPRRNAQHSTSPTSFTKSDYVTYCLYHCHNRLLALFFLASVSLTQHDNISPSPYHPHEDYQWIHNASVPSSTFSSRILSERKWRF